MDWIDGGLMQNKPRGVLAILGITSSVWLAGCSVMSKPSPLPRDGATMTQIYRSHTADEGMGEPKLDARYRQPLAYEDDAVTQAQRRALSDPLNNRFERLPNPDLTMFVYPHLSAGGKYPIPGYFTVFPMYESVQYAMPGEVAPRRQVSGSFTYPGSSTGRMSPPPRAIDASQAPPTTPPTPAAAKHQPGKPPKETR